MNATEILVSIILAAAIDKLSLGKTNIRDRIVSVVMVLPAIYSGWRGSSAAKLIEEFLYTAVGISIDVTSPKGNANVDKVVSVLVLVLWMWYLAKLIPSKTPWVGRAAGMKFKDAEMAFNTELWMLTGACALTVPLLGSNIRPIIVTLVEGAIKANYLIVGWFM